MQLLNKYIIAHNKFSKHHQLFKVQNLYDLATYICCHWIPLNVLFSHMWLVQIKNLKLLDALEDNCKELFQKERVVTPASLSRWPSFAWCVVVEAAAEHEMVRPPKSNPSRSFFPLLSTQLRCFLQATENPPHRSALPLSTPWQAGEEEQGGRDKRQSDDDVMKNQELPLPKCRSIKSVRTDSRTF